MSHCCIVSYVVRSWGVMGFLCFVASLCVCMFVERCECEAKEGKVNANVKILGCFPLVLLPFSLLAEVGLSNV